MRDLREQVESTLQSLRFLANDHEMSDAARAKVQLIRSRLTLALDPDWFEVERVCGRCGIDRLYVRFDEERLSCPGCGEFTGPEMALEDQQRRERSGEGMPS